MSIATAPTESDFVSEVERGELGGMLFLLFALAMREVHISGLSDSEDVEGARMPSVAFCDVGEGGVGVVVSVVGNVAVSGVCMPNLLPQRHSDG
jgi:hypothetical protein